MFYKLNSRLKKVILISFIYILTGAVSLWANERSSEKSEGAESGEEDFETREWSRKENRLKEYESQIHSLKDEIKYLIKEKNESSSSEQKRNLVKQIAEKHEEMNQIISKYNSLKLELKYKYPDKKAYQKKFVPLKKQTLEEIENEMGLD
ncbi:MAG: hypothetical protein D6797_00205, partial [Bdellovibrio sp.]